MAMLVGIPNEAISLMCLSGFFDFLPNMILSMRMYEEQDFLGDESEG